MTEDDFTRALLRLDASEQRNFSLDDLVTAYAKDHPHAVSSREETYQAKKHLTTMRLRGLVEKTSPRNASDDHLRYRLIPVSKAPSPDERVLQVLAELEAKGTTSVYAREVAQLCGYPRDVIIETVEAFTDGEERSPDDHENTASPRFDLYTLKRHGAPRIRFNRNLDPSSGSSSNNEEIALARGMFLTITESLWPTGVPEDLRPLVTELKDATMPILVKIADHANHLDRRRHQRRITHQ